MNCKVTNEDNSVAAQAEVDSKKIKRRPNIRFLPSSLCIFASWRAISLQNDLGKGSHGSSWIHHPSSHRAGIATQAGVSAVQTVVQDQPVLGVVCL